MHLNIKLKNMKTIKLTIMMVLVAFVAITNAVERPKLNVVPVNSDMAIVAVSNEKPAYFEISIETLSGETVYYRQTNEPVTDYNKIYDFSNLSKGNYVLSLKVNDTRISNEFVVSADGLKVGQNKMTFDPWFAFSDNRLKVSFLNFDQGNVELYLYNDEGLVYQSRLGRDFSITKGFDLSKLGKGSYKAVLSSASNEFTYHLSK